MALGVKGVVKKTRHLYIHEHTRIHIDNVENLGKFVELEVMFCFVRGYVQTIRISSFICVLSIISLQVCLNKNQTPEEGEKTAEIIMELLKIEKSDLVTGAYIDLLQKSLPS